MYIQSLASLGTTVCDNVTAIHCLTSPVASKGRGQGKIEKKNVEILLLKKKL